MTTARWLNKLKEISWLTVQPCKKSMVGRILGEDGVNIKKVARRKVAGTENLPLKQLYERSPNRCPT